MAPRDCPPIFSSRSEPRLGRRRYHPAVGPLLLAVAGAVALAIGILLLRSFGPGYRVGRLLATTPRVSIGEANALAAAGRRAYVRVDGRVDAAEPFEDADHRPLVFRRTRLEARTATGGAWQLIEDDRQTVPFVLREGLDEIAVDGGTIDVGLVVVPRESVGVAGDLPDRVPAHLPPTTPLRARVEQVSAVDHAIALGRPVSGAAPNGRPTLTAGAGRPLVLTTLEREEAMRILVGGRAGRARVAAVVLGTGVVLLAVAVAWTVLGVVLPALVPSVAAATPLPAATPATGGDPRSEGEGPGLVGEPLLAILGVAAIALLAVLAATAWVRLTDPARRPPPGSGR